MVGQVIRALLDTSAVIAAPGAITIGSNDTAAISVITLGELHAGVRAIGEPLHADGVGGELRRTGR